MGRYAAWLILCLCFLAAPATDGRAQALAATLKFCNERAALSVGQAEFAGAISLYGAEIDRYVTSQRADDDQLSIVKRCAADVRNRLCNLELIYSLLDPVDHATKIIGGGIAEKYILGSPGAGIMLAEIGGTITNVVQLANCNRKLAESYEPALKKVGAMNVVNLDRISGSVVRAALAQGHRAGRITAEELTRLTQFMGVIEKAARESE